MHLLEEELAQLPSLNSLYAKMHLRKLRLLKFQKLVEDTNAVAVGFGNVAIERENKLIEEVEQEINETLLKIKDAALACNIRIQQYDKQFHHLSQQQQEQEI